MKNKSRKRRKIINDQYKKYVKKKENSVTDINDSHISNYKPREVSK